jgi:hypothetical protein
MTKRSKRHLLTTTVLCLIGTGSFSSRASADVFEPMYAGPAAQAVEALQADVDADGTAEQRFALGVAQTCAAIERLTAAFNRYGLHSGGIINMRMIGAPVVVVRNPAEDAIDAATFREVLGRFYDDLAIAQQTLATVEPGPDMKVPLDITRVRLDYDGDGEAGPDEALGVLIQRMQDMQRSPFRAPAEEEPEPAGPEPFVIALDAGDVYWLRGYCHLLMGIGDFVLAHDTDDIFLSDRPAPGPEGWFTNVTDLIASIHLIRLEVKDPQRMTDALEHFRQVSQLSRQSWEAILAETDNEREWIPSPTQQSVLGDALVVDQARLDAWMQFLDEYDAIFAGEKLIPFWRGDKTKPLGVNLAKAFEEPQTFDLVLWVQGSAAAPYLEEGELTTPQFWRQLTGAFRGNFLTFAMIVN